MKRAGYMLGAATVGVLGLGLIKPDLGPGGGMVRAETETTLVMDVAVDCRKFTYMRGLALPNIVRGDRYIITSKLFPAGTLRPGNQTYDPDAPGSIGIWVGAGTSTDTLAGHLANPTSPAVFEHQYLLLGNGMVVAAGWFAPAGTSEIAMIGGTRAFRGATGELAIVDIGTNATGCPNPRMTIVLTKQAPK
jgi:hypothetical protein